MKIQMVRCSLLLVLCASSGFVYPKQPIQQAKAEQIKNELPEPKASVAAIDVIGSEDREPTDDGLYLIDSIKAVVYGQERTDLITLSDVNRPSLDGNQQTIEDLVVAKLICQDAARYKMEPDNDAVDKHLKSVQRENNLSLDDLKSIFSSAGYTYEEGREQFRAMTAIGTMIDFRIRSRLIVPEKDIQAYYQEHPIVQEPAYQIERAEVACPQGMDHGVFMQQLRRLIDTGQSKLDIEWSDPFWINKSELAQDKQFLTTIEVGCISMGTESGAGIELFKLMNKKEEHVTSLEERYNEIADTLKRPKYNELFEAYKKDLFSNAAVIYF